MAEADRRAMGAPQGTPTGPSPEPARRAPPSRRSEVFRRHPLDLWTGAPWSELPRLRWNLLVNATPVGMYPKIDESPVAPEWLTGEWVYDLIYNPARTRLPADCFSNAGTVPVYRAWDVQRRSNLEVRSKPHCVVPFGASKPNVYRPAKRTRRRSVLCDLAAWPFLSQ